MAIIAAVFCFNSLLLAALRRLDDSSDDMLSAVEVPNWAYKLLRRDLEAGPQDIKALARFPGGAWLAVLLLHQGLTFAALRLALTGSIAFRAAGIAAAVGTAAVGAALVATVHTGLSAPTDWGLGHAYVRDWPRLPVGPVVRRRPNPLLRLLLWGNGEWVSRARATHWAVRYQSVARQFSKEGAAPGVAAELAAQWGQAVAAALPTETWRLCGHARVLSLMVFLAHATWLLGSRPFRRPCDCVLAPVFLVLEAAVSAVQAWTFYSYVLPGWTCHELCESAVHTLLAAASAVLLLRMLLTHAGTFTLLLTGSRSQLQLLEWHETERRERVANPSAATSTPLQRPGSPGASRALPKARMFSQPVQTPGSPCPASRPAVELPLLAHAGSSDALSTTTASGSVALQGCRQKRALMLASGGRSANLLVATASLRARSDPPAGSGFRL
eukprot:TRINITY_DN15619_c0_g2_i2.p2 TRINITY_DN15619_c0_g2~~TRINITY_DN15619_c0_g2_i2.p2  ORF type:complete len:442 (+),score=47.52 TRINITY_DN15619_c0_g2_i2:1877-3202(+)